MDRGFRERESPMGRLLGAIEKGWCTNNLIGRIIFVLFVHQPSHLSGPRSPRAAQRQIRSNPAVFVPHCCHSLNCGGEDVLISCEVQSDVTATA